MKNTGITRRLDNLGRIVIPKEYRKKLRINEGELLELYLNNDEISIKKFEMINNEENFLKNLIYIIKDYVKCEILISDLERIIFSTDKTFINVKVSELIDNSVFKNNKRIEQINPSGDLIGYIIFYNFSEENNEAFLLFKNILKSYFE